MSFPQPLLQLLVCRHLSQAESWRPLFAAPMRRRGDNGRCQGLHARPVAALFVNTAAAVPTAPGGEEWGRDHAKPKLPSAHLSWVGQYKEPGAVGLGQTPERGRPPPSVPAAPTASCRGVEGRRWQGGARNVSGRRHPAAAGGEWRGLSMEKGKERRSRRCRSNCSARGGTERRLWQPPSAVRYRAQKRQGLSPELWSLISRPALRCYGRGGVSARSARRHRGEGGETKHRERQTERQKPRPSAAAAAAATGKSTKSVTQQSQPVVAVLP